MNGMERLTDAAARWGWDPKTRPGAGFTRTVVWTRGDQRVEVYRSVDGRVTYGSRSWGRTTATAPKVADQVLTWMQEPTPDDETDRGFFFRLATGHGWSFRGVSNGYVFEYVFEWGRTLGAPRITVHFGAGGALTRAERNFGAYGDIRSFHTNVPANITPWFHALMDDDHDCGCDSLETNQGCLNCYGTYRCEKHQSAGARHVAALKEGIPAKPTQEAAEPVIRPAVPNTPDRKLERLLADLEAGVRTLSQELEGRRIRPEGTGSWVYGQSALELASARLRRLEAEVLEARLLTVNLWRERATGEELEG